MLRSAVHLQPVGLASTGIRLQASQQRKQHVFASIGSTAPLTAPCPLRRTPFTEKCLTTNLPGRTAARGSVLVRSEDESVDVKDRALSALPYLVPLFDGLRYGKFAIAQTPFLYTLLSPLDPLLRLYLGVPFGSLIVFFAIYLGIINNQNLSRYVRINAMQAILLDILLILPGVFERVLKGPPADGFGLTIYMNVYNTIFWFVLVCWVYGTVSCVLGRAARLPLVGEAAEQQIR